MSLPRMTDVKCPGCGKKYEARIFDSINTDWPDAAEDIISGRLFEAVCPDCGHEAHLVYPLLFNDMKHNVMIMFVTDDSVEDTMDRIARSFTLGVFRVVTTQERLREKAAIFSAGLDDRMVEIYKVMLIESYREQIEEKKLKDIYFNSIGDSPKFELYFDGGEVLFSNMDMNAYKAIEAAPEIRKIVEDSGKTYLIDLDWAYDVCCGQPGAE